MKKFNVQNLRGFKDLAGLNFQKMPPHESKICPRCQAQFECKVGSINLCQCQMVSLNSAEMEYIRRKKFDDCLCANCLLELKKEHKQQLWKQKINRAYSYFNLKIPFKNE